MLKFCTLITGDEYILLKNETPYSKKKVRLYALVISIPVMMWAINSYLLTTQVLKKDIYTGIMVMVICSLIIFVIEKAIVMSNGSKVISLFRILLGLIVASIGALSLDEVVFNNDIDTQMSENKKEFVLQSIDKHKTELDAKIMKLESQVKFKDSIWQAAEKEAIKEADGTGGTGIPNVGKITQLKLRKAEESKLEYEKSKEELNSLAYSTDSTLKVNIDNINSSFNETGLLLRIQALFDLVSKDGWMKFIYILFTLLLVFLESLVILLKMFSKESNFERKVQLIERIGENRMRMLLENNSPIFDQVLFSDNLKSGTDVIKKPVNGMFH